ncbi:MAG: hypothetical protein IPF57_15455 [Gammaproteobacteria bacterium]|nr:hypothetical protein [Gammaproteobacteria bacterium]
MASAYMGRGQYERKWPTGLDDGLQAARTKLRGSSPPGFSLIGAGQHKLGIDNLEAAFEKDPSQARVGFALTVMCHQSGAPKALPNRDGAAVAERDQGAPGRNLLGVPAGRAGDKPGPVPCT